MSEKPQDEQLSGKVVCDVDHWWVRAVDPHPWQATCVNPRPAQPQVPAPSLDARGRIEAELRSSGCVGDVSLLASRLASIWPAPSAPSDALRADFDKLRSLVARSTLACIYCGVEAGGPCPAGYPGCGRMDDLMNDAAFVAKLGDDLQRHEEARASKNAGLVDASTLIDRCKLALDLIDVALADKSMTPGARVVAAWKVAQDALTLFSPPAPTAPKGPQR